MKTAQQIREAMSKRQQAQEWCEGFAMRMIEDTAKSKLTCMSLICARMDPEVITYIYDYLIKYGYTVQRKHIELVVSW